MVMAWRPVRCDCLCDCGSATTVVRGNLARTGSCGCLKQEKMSLLSGFASRNSVLCDYKISAKRKGRVWDIRDEEVFTLFKQPCSYCGSPPSRRRHVTGANGAFTFNGIDRIDSNLGYQQGNVAPCCRTCNVAKQDLTVADFLAHAALITGTYTYTSNEVDDPTTPEKCRVSQYRCNARYKDRPFYLDHRGRRPHVPIRLHVLQNATRWGH